MDGMSPPDVGNAGLGKTEKPRLALFDQLAGRAGHVLYRHRWIDAVLIEQVDKVGAKPSQTALHRLKDMLGPAVHADDPVAVETRAKLGGDHYPVAPAFECPAEQLLVGKGAIVFRRVEEGETVRGGIIIPDSAKEKPQEGEVVSVGKGKSNDEGKVFPLDVKAGDRVLFGKYSGTEIKIDGEEFLIMREEEVIGILKK